MSRGNVMTVELRMTMEQADQALEAFHKKWQDRFTITPTVNEPGASGQGPGASGATFGGLAGGGNPQAWRGQDPVIGRNIREPVIMGQKLTTLSPALQQIIAAQDPRSAAFLAALERPSMSPAAIRQAERFHQWNIRNEAYQRAQDVSAETRQHRDESYVDKRDFQDQLRSNREQVAGENRQHRDEGYVERSLRRDQAERVRGQNRQERDENAAEAADRRYERNRFKADLSGQSAPRRLALIEERMSQLDPESNEYQQLRGQRAQTALGTGLNRVIAPNHLYMQAMFAAMDVAGTVTHMARENALANASGTVQEALTHQIGAVTGGGGILSQILKGGWDVIGQFTGIRSPGQVEEQSLIEGRRTEIFNRADQIARQSRIQQAQQSAPAGTFRSQQLANYAQGANEWGALDVEINQVTGLLGIPNTPEMNAANMTHLKRLVQAKQDVQSRMDYRGELLEFQRSQLLSGQAFAGQEFGLSASGAGDDAVARKSMENRFTLESNQAKREQDPAFSNAVSERQRLERAAFEADISRRDQTARVVTAGLINHGGLSARGMSYEAQVSEIRTQGAVGALSTNPITRLLSAQLEEGALGAANAAFTRSVLNSRASNQGQIAVIGRLLAGDELGATLQSITNRTEQELNNGPQGIFRTFIEPMARKREVQEKELATTDFNNRRFLQKEQLEGTRDFFSDEAQGLDKSALVRRIANETNLAVDAATLAHRPDLQLIAAQTGLEQAKALERQFKIAQFTEGSAQEAPSGAYGQGGTSTVPLALEQETLQSGLNTVAKEIVTLQGLIRDLTTD